MNRPFSVERAQGCAALLLSILVVLACDCVATPPSAADAETASEAASSYEALFMPLDAQGENPAARDAIEKWVAAGARND